MEEFFLRRVLAGDELEIVDQQQVRAAQTLLERMRVARAHRCDEIIHEPLGGHAQHDRVRVMLEERMADRVHEVGLAPDKKGSGVGEKFVLDMYHWNA